MDRQFARSLTTRVHRAGCAGLILLATFDLWDLDVMAQKEGRGISLRADGWDLFGIGALLVAGSLGLHGARPRWVWGSLSALWLADLGLRVANR